MSADIAKQLLPCPFCGGSFCVVGEVKETPYKFYVVCPCGAQMGSARDADHAFFEEELVDAWNQRAQAKS